MTNIIGTSGNNTIVGVGQINTVDYSSLSQGITILPGGTVTKGTLGTDTLSNIQNIIGATGKTNTVDASSSTSTSNYIVFGEAASATSSTQSLAVNGTGVPFPLSFSLTNFNNVLGTAGNDTLIGGVGSYSFNGEGGTNTADYSSLSQGVTILPGGTVTKGTLGTDTLTSVQNIIGATGKTNTVDASSSTSTSNYIVFGEAASAINASASLAVNGTGSPFPLSFSLTNFNNILGTAGNDKFTGGFGNYTINGEGGTNTGDYSSLSQGITFSTSSGIVSKGSLGTDTLLNFQSIKGAVGKTNTLNIGCNSSGETVNLATGSVTGSGLNYSVSNFNNVVAMRGHATLIGGVGQSTFTLNGNGGSNVFEVYEPINGKNIMNITNFSASLDKIEINQSTSGITSLGQISYNQNTGGLYAGNQEFAVLLNHPCSFSISSSIQLIGSSSTSA